jgi:hypothetical protein
MKLMKRLLLALTAGLPVEEISHCGEKFMERYYVGTLLGWRFYIHRFVGSDPDGVHDHPWRRGFSIILSGWYHEEKREAIYKRRWFNVVNGDTFHRVVMAAGSEAWTLFAHDRRCKSWGFLREHSVYRIEHGMPVARTDGFFYAPLNPPHGHSTWHLTAPKGRDIARAP